MNNPALSPDASKLAFVLESNGVGDIWVVGPRAATPKPASPSPTIQCFACLVGPTENRCRQLWGNQRRDSLYRQKTPDWHRQQKKKLLETPV